MIVALAVCGIVALILSQCFRIYIYEEGEESPQKPMLQLGINPEDGYAMRLVWFSPLIKEREYLDPNDFLLKTGPTRLARAWLLRKCPRGKPDAKLAFFDTGVIVAAVR